MEIWESKALGTLGATPDLLQDSFTFFTIFPLPNSCPFPIPYVGSKNLLRYKGVCSVSKLMFLE